MADRTLRHGDGKISCKHGKWYLLIPYVVEDIEKPALKDDVVMGVKFGTDVAFSYAFNNTLTQRQVRGGEILAFENGSGNDGSASRTSIPYPAARDTAGKKPSVYSAPSSSRNRTSGPV